MFSLYIDPGTGSMLFSLVIGLVATLTFGLRALFVKIRFGFNKKDIAEEKDVIPYVIFSKSLKKEESMWSIILLALMIRLFLVE